MDKENTANHGCAELQAHVGNYVAILAESRIDHEFGEVQGVLVNGWSRNFNSSAGCSSLLVVYW